VSIYYPQAAATLRIVWENFGDELNPALKQAHTMQVLLKRARVTINSYTEADTFEMELDYKIFPFDPRCIRSCQVSIHMQNMGRLYDGSVNVRLEPSTENTIFQGFVDDETMTFDDSTRTVRLKGRDFTALFVDTTWTGKTLNLTAPVDVLIAQMLLDLKQSDILVDNRTGGSLPVLAKFYPDFGLLSGQRNARKKESYWDVIQDICTKAGLIAYMELDKLVITKPRTLYDPNKAIQFVYGRNISSFELKRNLGKQKGFNIRVRALVGKTVLLADIPKDSTALENGGQEVKIPKQDAQGNLQEQAAPYLSFVVANVNSKDQLIKIGEKIYEELSRQQIEGRFETHDMEAPIGEEQTGGNEECFDLTKLRNGTPVQILISMDDLDAIKREQSQATRFKYLIDRCYPAQVATIFAATLGKYSTPFYTRSVDFTIDADNGFKVEVDFINFIETKNKGLGI